MSTTHCSDPSLRAATAHLEPEDRAVERAVPEQSDAARVGRHVAADLAGALGPQVQRHGEALVGEVAIEGCQDAARLCSCADGTGALS